jgi:SpoVK/Ycf46/Vps4 family AAA+-type ATPase
LIKALAQYTGRSIVNVPLSKVSTNSELMSIFFDRKYQVEGAYVSVKLGFKDVIFVMEDVDAASKIVKRRDGKTSAEVVEPQKIDLPMPKSLWCMFLESASSDCKDLVEQLEEKSEKLKEEAEKLKPEVLKAIAQRVTSLPALGLVGEGVDDTIIGKLCEEALESGNKLKEQYSKLDTILSSHAQAIKALLDSGTEVDDKFVDELLGEARSLSAPISATVSKPSGSDNNTTLKEFEAPRILDQSMFSASSDSGSKSKGLGFGPSFLRPNPDQLSLSGLLNVLDGVVDSPGRILIMTTNHPEMLDPALIRPGRIDKKLMLGYMAAADIVGMLEHYFQTTLTSSQIAQVETIVDASRLNLTPAQVEQLAVEHDELDDMIGAMEKMGRPSLAKFVSKSNSTVALRP